MRKIIAVIAGALVLLGLAASFADASTKPAVVARPMVGVQGQWNAPMCGSNDWERVKTPATEYSVSDSADTCVTSERYHATFQVSEVLSNLGWQYPSIAAGYVPTGESTCASSRDSCFKFPVQAKDDGAPEQSFGSWISAGYQGNESDDIWFSPVKNRHSVDERSGDTELMIWFAYPGIHEHLKDFTTIDGRRFGIMTWIAHHDGTQWRYVAYLWLNADNEYRGHQVNVSGLRLNPFFLNAESHGWLSPDEWLWAINDGFEMNKRGQWDNIHNESLTGVN